MKYFLFLFMLVPTCILAQEKIGNKIYKYGDLYHAVHGSTVVTFEDAKAKTMNKTLEYFTKAGAKIKSLNSLYPLLATCWGSSLYCEGNPLIKLQYLRIKCHSFCHDQAIEFCGTFL